MVGGGESLDTGKTVADVGSRLASRILVAALVSSLAACGKVAPVKQPTAAAIEEAEGRSPVTPVRELIDRSRESAVWRGVRNRSYFYCYRAARQQINKQCGAEQDEAIHRVLLSLLMSALVVRTHPNEKTRYISTSKQSVAAAVHYCWQIYRDNGLRDARILDVCLSNLGDWGTVVPSPFGVD